MESLRNQFKLMMATMNNVVNQNTTNFNSLNTRVAYNEKDIHLLKNNNNSIPINILSKIKKATCQIVSIINNKEYYGSGCYYYENELELSNGYFITSAQCVMLIENNEYYKATKIFLQNPINNKWTSIYVNNIYIDGIADVALIKTNIDLTHCAEYCLKISNDIVNEGDICYVVGNPGNKDEDSISVGFVRNANYCMNTGLQQTNSIFINAPCIGGNLGGPIINKSGDIIGIYTFSALGGIECFGGGSNQEVLKFTLSELKKEIDNKSKLYLGLKWSIKSPIILDKLYYYRNPNEFDSMGVCIEDVTELSPFNGIINIGDLLLSCTVKNTTIYFGNKENERTPGVLLYYPIDSDITINYIEFLNINQNIYTKNVKLNKSYNDVSNLLDGPLQTITEYSDSQANNFFSYSPTFRTQDQINLLSKSNIDAIYKARGFGVKYYILDLVLFNSPLLNYAIGLIDNDDLFNTLINSQNGDPSTEKSTITILKLLDPNQINILMTFNFQDIDNSSLDLLRQLIIQNIQTTI